MVEKPLLKEITRVVASLCWKSNYGLRDDVFEALQKAEKREKESLPKAALGKLIENACIAREKRIPLCQDTGVAEVFLEIGQETRVEGDAFIKAVNNGIREGYEKGYLRKSIVADPLFSRTNTGDNTPALIHFIFESPWRNKVKITLFPKGFGSENKSGNPVVNITSGPNGGDNYQITSSSVSISASANESVSWQWDKVCCPSASLSNTNSSTINVSNMQ